MIITFSKLCSCGRCQQVSGILLILATGAVYVRNAVAKLFHNVFVNNNNFL